MFHETNHRDIGVPPFMEALCYFQARAPPAVSWLGCTTDPLAPGS